MWLSLVKNLVRSLVVLIVVTFATFSLMYGNATGIAHAVLGKSATPHAVRCSIRQSSTLLAPPACAMTAS